MGGFLPAGVQLRTLDAHDDHRGRFTEIFRNHWETGIAPIQWNVVSSHGGVLRGVHVHLRHSDYFLLLAGRASIGLHDLRPESPTIGRSALVELSDASMQALTIPPGVAHGFYFHEPSIHAYAVSHYFDPEDELGCHWQDPALRITWPASQADTSARDAAAPPLSALVERLAAVRATARSITQPAP